MEQDQEESSLPATAYAVSCNGKDALEWFNKGSFAFITLKGNAMACFDKALELDPDFLLVHCVMGMFLLEDLKPPNHPLLVPHLEAAMKASKTKCNVREAAYVKAFLFYASGDLIKCTDEFIAMLKDFPLDTLALRFVAGYTIRIGDFEKARDTVASALAFWKENMELYPYVLAFYAFALEETNEREKAEKLLRKTLSHVMDRSHVARDGVEFLTATRPEWEDSDFGNHIAWHLTLHYFDMGNIDAVFSEYDNTLSKNVKSSNLFDLLDASSLLWRLNVMGIDAGQERWAKVSDALAERAHNHRSPWFDAHIMMGLANGKVNQAAARLTLAKEMLQSMKEYSENDSAINRTLSDKLGVPVCTALLAYGQERYEDVLQLMLPLRCNFRQFGGSWAQRQVFHHTLIQAAIKAKKTSVARDLIAELKAQKPLCKTVYCMNCELTIAS